MNNQQSHPENNYSLSKTMPARGRSALGGNNQQSATRPNIAFVYDWVDKIGGAEKVLQNLHQIWPDAPLYTSVYNPQTAPWAKDFDVHTSFLQNLPFAKQKHEFYPWLMPFVFQSFDFQEFDVVISVTSAAAKGIITKPDTLHICYCLTPTRYLWSAHQDYRENTGFGVFNPFARTVFKMITPKLKQWDYLAAQRPDKYLAISQAVKQRINNYYSRDSKVIYPPIDVDQFSTKKQNKGEYFLVVSRLVPYKRVDLAVRAFNQLQLPLKVVGQGSQRRRLEQMAEENVHFLGQLTDEQLVRYYQNCRALIMPQEEDFGIVSLEAQAAGKPVVAFQKGGAKDTIVAGETGILFEEQTVDSLKKAVKKLQKKRFSAQLCFENALKFDKNSFRTLIKNYLEEQWQKLINS